MGTRFVYRLGLQFLMRVNGAGRGVDKFSSVVNRMYMEPKARYRILYHIHGNLRPQVLDMLQRVSLTTCLCDCASKHWTPNAVGCRHARRHEVHFWWPCAAARDGLHEPVQARVPQVASKQQLDVCLALSSFFLLYCFWNDFLFKIVQLTNWRP